MAKFPYFLFHKAIYSLFNVFIICLYYLSQFAIRLMSSILPRAVPQEDDEVGRSDGGGGRRDEGRFRSCPRFHSQIHVGAEWNGMREGDREGTHRTNTTQSPFAPLVFLLANPTVKQSCRRWCENPRLSFLLLLRPEEEAFATTFTAAEHKGTSPLCSLDSFSQQKVSPSFIKRELGVHKLEAAAAN